jgi:hypothetical protein
MPPCLHWRRQQQQPTAAGMRPPDRILENGLGGGLCMALEPLTQILGPISPRTPDCFLAPETDSINQKLNVYNRCLQLQLCLLDFRPAP